MDSARNTHHYTEQTQLITNQFTHLLKIPFYKNCRKHKQKKRWKEGKNKNYEITAFFTGVKTWLLCVLRGSAGLNLLAAKASLWIIHQATASQEFHSWSRSFWAHGLSRGFVEPTQWKDVKYMKIRHRIFLVSCSAIFLGGQTALMRILLWMRHLAMASVKKLERDSVWIKFKTAPFRTV